MPAVTLTYSLIPKNKMGKEQKRNRRIEEKKGKGCENRGHKISIELSFSSFFLC